MRHPPAARAAMPAWAGFALIVAATVVAYVPALGAGFVWDDEQFVTHNPLVADWAGLWRAWLPGTTPQYYPLTYTTFWIEHRLLGTSPLGYHLVNVLGHALNACILWRVLRRLAAPGAWLAAAIFALHPVHVESVAWVTELKNVQSGSFYLLAALALVGVEGARRPRRRYGAGLGAFLGAILSKTVTCTLPVALLPCLWWQRGAVGRPELRRVAPLLLVGIPVGLGTVWMERHVVGARGMDWSLTPLERCLIAGRALWFYAYKLVWPGELVFVYPRWTIDASAWWQYLFPLGAAGVVVLLWAWRDRLGRGPLAGVLFFAVTLGPALGFFDIYPMLFSFVADHFQYLASIGLIALAAGAAAVHTAPWRSTRGGAAGAGAAAVVVLGLLGTLTWRQAGIYRTQEILWRHTVERNPSAWMAHLNLGVLLLNEGRLDDAEPHLRAALALRPTDINALHQLGNVAIARGRLAEAEGYFARALEIDPRFAAAHNNLANVYAYQGRLAEAIEHYEKALAIAPDYADARANLEAVRAARRPPAAGP